MFLTFSLLERLERTECSKDQLQRVCARLSRSYTFTKQADTSVDVISEQQAAAKESRHGRNLKSNVSPTATLPQPSTQTTRPAGFMWRKQKKGKTRRYCSIPLAKAYMWSRNKPVEIPPGVDLVMCDPQSALIHLVGKPQWLQGSQLQDSHRMTWKWTSSH